MMSRLLKFRVGISIAAAIVLIGAIILGIRFMTKSPPAQIEPPQEDVSAKSFNELTQAQKEVLVAEMSFTTTTPPAEPGSQQPIRAEESLSQVMSTKKKGPGAISDDSLNGLLDSMSAQ